MKNILNLKNITLLSKEDQGKITGAARSQCYQKDYRCCVGTPHGELCDAGICKSNGYCFYY
ncbi:hypothetical protein [Aquimarina sp. 2201CG5-10]|uniref:hypothetical protein n=1 Tax=Aquimarina callyspongiae TaxID=3098150 RepID=UPI002AB436A3|nr:hypothetical protein [Aquimarina sp. 2201CG5-10]MDY8136220.1 hypothetical protein [Aquimarina sp. 2201CG5-10]